MTRRKRVDRPSYHVLVSVPAESVAALDALDFLAKQSKRSKSEVVVALLLDSAKRRGWQPKAAAKEPEAE